MILLILIISLSFLILYRQREYEFNLLLKLNLNLLILSICYFARNKSYNNWLSLCFLIYILSILVLFSLAKPKEQKRVK